MNHEHFFEPYVGEQYQEGIGGKKILVLGASFYCDHTECPFFSDCTGVERKDSAPYEDRCPEYKAAGKSLRLEPSYCVEDAPVAYQRFAAYFGQWFETDDYEQVWNHLAFTNYVQFMLPGADGKFRETRLSDLSERDFKAFNEVLQALQPDIVVVWGGIINSRLKERNPYLVSLKELQETDYYVCHLNQPGVPHPIALINPYHPSSSAWYSALETFNSYFTSLLKENSIH